MAPRDGFETFYTEKLWELVPEVYKHEDGVAEKPGVLRALIEIAGAHAAVARRGVDRVWDNQFGEFADDWALPYIGELVGTRLVSALNRTGRRADVVRTIFYRRRKGTLALLEMLIRDIGRWDGVVVEAFRRLGRTPHRLDPPLAGRGAQRTGLVTATPPGGLADLRASRGGDLVDGPFEEYSRTADVRQLRGRLGRFNIPKLNFHLYRQMAFDVSFATPFDLGGDRYTFDPSGRDVALFRPSQQDDDDCTRAEEWRIAAPLPCRLLGEARYVIEPDDVAAAIAPLVAPLFGVLVTTESELRQILATLLSPAQFAANIYPILAASITDDSPKRNLMPSAVAVAVGGLITTAPFPRERVVAANLALGAIFTTPAGKMVAIDPARGHFQLLTPPAPGARVFVPAHHVGLFGPLGAGTYDRHDAVVGPTPTTPVTFLPDGGPANPGPVVVAMPIDGVHEFTNSKTYDPTSPAGGTVTNVRQLTLQASDGARPYVRLVPQGGGSRWTFRAQPKPAGFDPLDPANRRTVVIDGLWLGVLPSGLAAQAVASPSVPVTPVPTTLAFDGVFDEVVIRHCSVDPGGERARMLPNQVTAVPAVQIELQGAIETLVIEQSVVGSIHEVASASDPCSAARVIVRDSVVQSIVPATPAIRTRFAKLVLERSTVFGDVVVNRLEASEALVAGLVQVTDNQHGCFRFSATLDVPAARLPRQFESHLIAPVVLPPLFVPEFPRHVFVSRRFGDAGYAQLSATAPETLRRGAENGSEIGAWSRLLTPIKLDDLKAKVAEFMPFGLIAQFIEET